MIASFRMYNAVPRAAQAWRALFARVFADAGTDIRMIEHAWPEPIDALWAKPDLACAFMCGWPFARSPGMQAIAAPVPSRSPSTATAWLPTCGCTRRARWRRR